MEPMGINATIAHPSTSNGERNGGRRDGYELITGGSALMIEKDEQVDDDEMRKAMVRNRLRLMRSFPWIF